MADPPMTLLLSHLSSLMWIFSPFPIDHMTESLIVILPVNMLYHPQEGLDPFYAFHKLLFG